MADRAPRNLSPKSDFGLAPGVGQVYDHKTTLSDKLAGYKSENIEDRRTKPDEDTGVAHEAAIESAKRAVNPPLLSRINDAVRDYTAPGTTEDTSGPNSNLSKLSTPKGM